MLENTAINHIIDDISRRIKTAGTLLCVFTGFRIDIVQLHLYVVGRDADRTDLGLAYAGIGDERCCLGEAVADGVRELGLDEEIFHYRIKFGTADAEEFQFAAEGLVQTFSDEEVQQFWCLFPHP